MYSDKAMSRVRVFERQKRFSGGWKEVGDDERSGRPVTASIEGKVQKKIVA